uniref:DUF7869 domain-containing protein n=1 Tax=Phytophthora ramorum TaxID=164328 RepID=H3GTE5_PHYRM
MQGHQPRDAPPSSAPPPSPDPPAVAPPSTRSEGGEGQPQPEVHASIHSDESIEGREDAESEDDSSKERDDSGDEDFSPQSGEGSEEEASTAESAESAAESEENLSSFCLMTKKKKNTSLYTLLAVLMQVPVDCKRRYKTRIRHGNMSVKEHGNKLNKNTSQVDVVWLVRWFTRFAVEVGEVVSVRVRMHKEINGSIQKYHIIEKYTLLPAHFTWDAIWDEMHAFVQSGLRVLIVMDYSQNLTTPSVASTPSQWYFCSLVSVNCFGIYYENDNAQTNYIYAETTSGKGSDQVISMRTHFLETKLVASGKTKLAAYADNCSGKNKNIYVIKFLLTLVDMGTFEHVGFKFFVKGHTKNSCDRGFGHIRKNLATAE